MKTLRMILLLGLGLGVSACGSVEVPTRNAPFEDLPKSTLQIPQGHAAKGMKNPTAVAALASSEQKKVAVAPGKSPVRVRKVIVRVPRELKVSEANSYLPSGDIVWREDPIGDRYVQVQKIVEDAMTRGVKPLDGPVPIDLHVQVAKFHALTEKARYSFGGVHAITFHMVLTDARTGEPIVPIRTVRADLDAFGGSQAMRAEAQGLTQKVRITSHLAEVIRQELTDPAGFRDATTGFIQRLNYM